MTPWTPGNHDHNNDNDHDNDTLYSRLEGDTLYARRLIMKVIHIIIITITNMTIMKTNPLPSWGKHFFSARRVAVIEEVMVDRSVMMMMMMMLDVAKLKAPIMVQLKLKIMGGTEPDDWEDCHHRPPEQLLITLHFSSAPGAGLSWCGTHGTLDSRASWRLWSGRR